MFGKRIELFRLFGFAVRVDPSWLVLAVLITWSYATQVFPAVHGGLAPRTYWAMGAAMALGLFASIVLHELAHSLVARHYGMEMRGITLFVFGGVAEMTDEPPSPEAEFMMAVAGPAASLFIAGSLLLLWVWAGMSRWPPPVTIVAGQLAFLNGTLALFNAVPAFPLDGGRVLRAALWHWKKDLRWATRMAARMGSLFGAVLIALGLVWVIGGQVAAGIWSALIGFFVRAAAQMSYQQLLLRRTLEGEPVRRFMRADPVVVPRAISLRRLVEDFVYRHHHKLFPVVDGDRLVGCITTGRLKQVPPEEWDRQSVGAVAEPCGPENTVSPDTDAMEALSLMNRSRASRLMVVEEGRLVGILTLKDLLQFFSLKMELEGAGGAAGRG
jgi:Zn-dependent protease/CBS domain-containing protein